MNMIHSKLYFGDTQQILTHLDNGDCSGDLELLEAAVAGLARNLIRLEQEDKPRKYTRLARGRTLGDRSAPGILAMMVEGIAHARAEVQAQRWTIGQKDAYINGLELTARKFLESEDRNAHA